MDTDLLSVSEFAKALGKGRGPQQPGVESAAVQDRAEMDQAVATEPACGRVGPDDEDRDTVGDPRGRCSDLLSSFHHERSNPDIQTVTARPNRTIPGPCDRRRVADGAEKCRRGVQPPAGVGLYHERFCHD
jgi:hypothetical protein